MTLREGLAVLMEKYPDKACQVEAKVHNFHPNGPLLEFLAYVDTGPDGTHGETSATIALAVESVLLRIAGHKSAPAADTLDVDDNGAEVERCPS